MPILISVSSSAFSRKQRRGPSLLARNALCRRKKEKKKKRQFALGRFDPAAARISGRGKEEWGGRAS